MGERLENSSTKFKLTDEELESVTGGIDHSAEHLSEFFRELDRASGQVDGEVREEEADKPDSR